MSLPEIEFTYVAAQVATTPLFKVRLLIGDTDRDDPQLDDAEITWMLSQTGSNAVRAAVAACNALEARYARLVDSTVSDVSFAYSQRAEHYRALAARIASGNLGATAGVIPYSGGTSLADIDTVEGDTDRPRSEFAIGMNDNEGGTTGALSPRVTP